MKHEQGLLLITSQDESIELTDEEFDLILRALRNVGVYQSDTDSEEALIKKLEL